MKQPSELLSEARIDRRTKEDQAFEAFCKHELLYLNDIIERKEKDLASSVDRMDSYTLENLKKMFEDKEMYVNMTHKQKWLNKLFPDEFPLNN